MLATNQTCKGIVPDIWNENWKIGSGTIDILWLVSTPSISQVINCSLACQNFNPCIRCGVLYLISKLAVKWILIVVKCMGHGSYKFVCWSSKSLWSRWWELISYHIMTVSLVRERESWGQESEKENGLYHKSISFIWSFMYAMVSISSIWRFDHIFTFYLISDICSFLSWLHLLRCIRTG